MTMLSAGNFDTFWKELIALSARLLPQIGIGLLIFTAFCIASAVLSKVGQRVTGRVAGSRRVVIALLFRLGNYALLGFGLITALGTLGINVSALVAGLGLTGF